MLCCATHARRVYQDSSRLPRARVPRPGRPRVWHLPASTAPTSSPTRRIRARRQRGGQGVFGAMPRDEWGSAGPARAFGMRLRARGRGDCPSTTRTECDPLLRCGRHWCWRRKPTVTCSLTKRGKSRKKKNRAGGGAKGGSAPIQSAEAGGRRAAPIGQLDSTKRTARSTSPQQPQKLHQPRSRAAPGLRQGCAGLPLPRDALSWRPPCSKRLPPCDSPVPRTRDWASHIPLSAPFRPQQTFGFLCVFQRM